MSYEKINMNKLSSPWLLVFAMVTTLSSCELAGGIFKAGAYTAIIVIVLVIIIILWIVRKMRR
jgi:hypothetical protein